MKRYLLLPAAYLVDQLAGDPEWFPHPVRLMGQVVARGETIVRRHGQTAAFEFISGAALTLTVIGSTYGLTFAILRLVRRHSAHLGDATELLLAWTCLAARNLNDEATSVTDALSSGDLPHARRRLARIVGRDTDHLNPHEISRAVIETVAESASDGVIAPLFFMVLGGAPLAMAYKAVNTLDSMIGHNDARYVFFGKFAARLDDAANFLPSRITAMAIILASHSISPLASRAAWHIWLRDGSKHKSPNAGQPESAMAGALGAELGGNNTYAGELLPTPRIGRGFPAPTLEKALQAIRIVAAASFLTLCLGAATAFAVNTKGGH